MLPILFGLAAGAVILPFMPLYLFAQPSLETLCVVLFALGLYPFILSFLHGAIFIEHFITRKISKRFVDDNMLPDPQYMRLSIYAGAFLAKALTRFGPALDVDTLQRGQTLLGRHQAINRFIWPGLGISAIAAIGMVLLKEFGISWTQI